MQCQEEAGCGVTYFVLLPHQLGGFPMFASHPQIPGVLSLQFIAQQIDPPGFVFLNCPLVQFVPLDKGHFVSSTLSPGLPRLQHRQCLADTVQIQKMPGIKGSCGWRTLSSEIQELPDTRAPTTSLCDGNCNRVIFREQFGTFRPPNV